MVKQEGLEGESQKAGLPTPLSIPVRVGTMGWGYTDWSGPFYPSTSASRDFITQYARAFDVVEIDSTFYATPREALVKQWHKATPETFVFCPKVPRAITHEMRLRDVMEPLAEFVRVMGLLGLKRGPMLLQMPPDFTRAELPALEAFLPALRGLPDRSARFAIEFRHRSLIGPDISQLLKEHQIALASADYAPMPRRFEITSDFVYMRLIGRHGAYPHHDRLYGDRDADLQRWAGALHDHQAALSSVYVFCNNDYEGYAPDTANRFRRWVGLPARTFPSQEQGSLF